MGEQGPLPWCRCDVRVRGGTGGLDPGVATQKSSGNRQPKCSSFAERLAAAERKAYALKKERDALKKASEQSDGLAAKLREKDEMIQEVRVLGRFADGAETLRT